MRIVRLAVALAFVGLGGCAHKAAPATAVAPANAAAVPAKPALLLWEARGPKGVVHLFGTMHIGSAADVPDAAWHALERDQWFSAEMNADDVNPLKAMTAMMLPATESLQAMLGPKD